MVVQRLATGDRKTLLTGGATDARYLPTGHLVFLRQGRLFAVSFDPTRLQKTGTEVPILGEVAQALTASAPGSITGAGQFAISAAGTLAWVRSPVVPYPSARWSPWTETAA